MFAARSAIAVLQETAIINHWPWPLYEMIPEENGFRGTVMVGYLSESAFAINKKRAKQLCAERLLKILNSPRLSSTSEDLIYRKELEKESNLKDDINFNAVSRLNEVCIRGPHKPTYADVWANEKGFTVECRLSSISTRGEGFTKKEAKQVAAYTMLKSINVLDFQHDSKFKFEKNINSPYLKQNNLSKNNNILLSQQRHDGRNPLLDIFNNLKPEEKKIAEQTNQLIRDSADSEEISTRVKQMVKKFENLSSN